MKSAIRKCALLLMTLTVWAKPALARSYLDCLTTKVVIVDAPSGNTSLSTEENLGFWVDEAAKIITLADGTPLIVRRFDDRWISACPCRKLHIAGEAAPSPSPQIVSKILQRGSHALI